MSILWEPIEPPYTTVCGDEIDITPRKRPGGGFRLEIVAPSDTEYLEILCGPPDAESYLEDGPLLKFFSEDVSNCLVKSCSSGCGESVYIPRSTPEGRPYLLPEGDDIFVLALAYSDFQEEAFGGRATIAEIEKWYRDYGIEFADHLTVLSGEIVFHQGLN